MVGAHGGKRAQPGVESRLAPMPSTPRRPTRPRHRLGIVAWAHGPHPTQARGVLVLPLSSRSATTVGSTRCSGRPRCARGHSRRRGSDAPGLRRCSTAGAGTGFTTGGHRRAHRSRAGSRCSTRARTSSPARAAKPALGRPAGSCSVTPSGAAVRGRAPFDRYVSAGSIEYWPDPQRGIAEAHRVLREGGTGVVIGPVEPARPAGCERLVGRVDAVASPRRTTAPGSSGRASRTCRCTRWPPTGTAAAPSTRSPSAAPDKAHPRYPARCWMARSDPGGGGGPLGAAHGSPAARASRPASCSARRRASCSCRSAPRCAPRPAGTPLMTAHRAPSPYLRALASVLWRFSRPHTVIGTAVSVVGLFAPRGRARSGAVDAGERGVPAVLDAGRGAVGEHLHRRHQPDHRRRDRPRQQARPADRRR